MGCSHISSGIPYLVRCKAQGSALLGWDFAEPQCNDPFSPWGQRGDTSTILLTRQNPHFALKVVGSKGFHQKTCTISLIPVDAGIPLHCQSAFF